MEQNEKIESVKQIDLNLEITLQDLMSRDGKDYCRVNNQLIIDRDGKAMTNAEVAVWLVWNKPSICKA